MELSNEERRSRPARDGDVEGNNSAAYSLRSQVSGGLTGLDPPALLHRTADPEREAREVVQDAMNRNFRRLLRAAVTSNCLLFLGGALFIAFIIREMITFCRRDIVADILYAFASGAFLISGLIQFIIDVAWTRTIPTGRYTANRRLNIFISTLFLAGVVADFAAFMFWRQGESGVPKERTAQWVSTHLWFLASIIVILTNLQRSSQLEDKLDSIGNLFFLWESVMNVCARYVTDTNPELGQSLDYTELRFELSAAVFWTCNAFFYLCGDMVRFRQYRKKKNQTDTKSDPGPLSS